MPQRLTQKVVNTFIKGLITEAGEMTFPQDASVDELNCALFRDGSRRRREGLVFENDNVLSSFTLTNDEVISTGTWKNVGGVAEREYLVVQVGTSVYFYEKLDPPYSSHERKNISIDLTDYEASNSSSTNSKCSFASINGVLVIASPAIDTLYVQQTSEDRLSVNKINFRVRDFQWQSDKRLLTEPNYLEGNASYIESLGLPVIRQTFPLSRNEDPEDDTVTYKVFYTNGSTNTFTFSPASYILRVYDGSREIEGGDIEVTPGVFYPFDDYIAEFGLDFEGITPQRQYDTYNVGWVTDKGANALQDYIDDKVAFPPLTIPWYSGKTAEGVFSVAEWEKTFVGTTLASNGHFILDFFNKDRSTASGLDDIPTEVEDSRFTTVVSFAGRVFYSGLDSATNSGVILFSQLLDAPNRLALYDASGLGECIQQNDPTAEDLSDLLDTDGGVIRIPDAIGIKKLHVYNNALYVFAENGVWLIKGVDDVFRATQYAVNKISSVGLLNPDSFVSADGVPFWWSQYAIHTLQFQQGTLQPQETNLTLTTIQSFYDQINLSAREKTFGIFDEINKRIFWFYPDNDETFVNKYNNILVLDLSLGAFYPWKVSDQTSDTSYIVGAAYFTGFGAREQDTEVITSIGDDVFTSNGDNVIVPLVTGITTGEPGIVMLVADNQGSGTYKLTMALFNGSGFLDWGSASYLSFAEAGYDFMGDAMTEKTAPYIQVYMRVTDSDTRPSSLLLSSFWDFKTTASTPAQQAYRLKTLLAQSETYPNTLIDTRLKIRGKGKSMRLKFESEEGKDFVLVGYGILHGRNTRF